MKIANKKLTSISVLTVLLVFLLLSTSPDSLPLPLVITPFILIFAILYLFTRLLLDGYAPNLGTRAKRGLSLIIAALPVLLLILQSISQLTARDLLITLGLILLLLFYFRKIDFLT